jgi:hypothetical protein
MWPFRDKAKSSSWIDELEDSLVNRPWEWKLYYYEETTDQYLENELSGVTIEWRGATYDSVTLSGRNLDRIVSGKVLPVVFKHLAIRSKFATRIDFNATAKAMANAVLAGETTAAYGLADHIIENCKREENN